MIINHKIFSKIFVIKQYRIIFVYNKSENSSVGRAQPCQGWGREFESRFSLPKVFRISYSKDFSIIICIIFDSVRKTEFSNIYNK